MIGRQLTLDNQLFLKINFNFFYFFLQWAGLHVKVNATESLHIDILTDIPLDQYYIYVQLEVGEKSEMIIFMLALAVS